MEYNKKVTEHFLHPHNLGRLPKYNYTAEAANPTCGDAVKFYFDVDSKSERIEKVGIEVLGCGAAIASCSVASEMLTGKTLTEAKKISNQAIVDELGGLPSEKINCSLLVEQAVGRVKINK